MAGHNSRHEIEVGGARVVGAGQHHEQRRGVDAEVVWRDVAAARLVEDLAGLGAVGGEAVRALRGREISQHVARDIRPQPQRLQRDDDGVAPEEPRPARAGPRPECVHAAWR